MPMTVRLQAHDIIRTWAFYTITKSVFTFTSLVTMIFPESKILTKALDSEFAFLTITFSDIADESMSGIIFNFET